MVIYNFSELIMLFFAKTNWPPQRQYQWEFQLEDILS